MLRRVAPLRTYVSGGTYRLHHRGDKYFFAACFDFYLLLTLFLACRFLSPWGWRRYVPTSILTRATRRNITEDTILLTLQQSALLCRQHRLAWIQLTVSWDMRCNDLNTSKMPTELLRRAPGSEIGPQALNLVFRQMQTLLYPFWPLSSRTDNMHTSSSVPSARFRAELRTSCVFSWRFRTPLHILPPVSTHPPSRVRDLGVRKRHHEDLILGDVTNI
jgi:hypothetical protein